MPLRERELHGQGTLAMSDILRDRWGPAETRLRGPSSPPDEGQRTCTACTGCMEQSSPGAYPEVVLLGPRRPTPLFLRQCVRLAP